jgi:hypothetical protein
MLLNALPPCRKDSLVNTNAKAQAALSIRGREAAHYNALTLRRDPGRGIGA